MRSESNTLPGDLMDIIPFALLTYSTETGLLYSKNDQLTRLIGSEDLWKEGRTLHSLRHLFKNSDGRAALAYLSKKNIQKSRTEKMEFFLPFRFCTGHTKWLSFVILENENPSRNRVGNEYLIVVSDVTSSMKANRNENLNVRLNFFNEKRRRNSWAKAVIDQMENELEEVAVEIHEELGAKLVLIKQGLQEIGGGATGQGGVVVDELIDLCQDSISRIRKIHFYIAPAGLKEFGLESKLSGLRNSLAGKYPFAINYESNLKNIRFTDFIEINYYRMAQELISNALQFSEARNIYIVLRYEFNRLILMVADDGVGFSPEKLNTTERIMERKRKGNGLRNIQERCKVLNCSFAIFAAPEEGCRVIIEKEIRNFL